MASEAFLPDCWGNDWGNDWVHRPATGIQLASGRLFVCGSYRPFSKYSQKPPVSSSVRCIASDDHGTTWHKAGMANHTGMPGGAGDHEPNEVQPVQLANGSVLLNARDVGRHGRRILARSDDNGDTFGAIWLPEELVDYPSTEGSTITHGGCMYLSNLGQTWDDRSTNDGCGHSPQPLVCGQRHNLTLRASCDQGATWSLLGTIYGGPAAYSSLESLPWRKDAIGVLFENGPGPVSAMNATTPYMNLAFTELPVASVPAVATNTEQQPTTPTTPTTPTLIPLPQCLEHRPGGNVSLSAGTRITFAPDAPQETLFAAQWLRTGIQQACSAGISSTRVLLGVPGDPAVQSLMVARGLHFSERLGTEGYILDVPGSSSSSGINGGGSGGGTILLAAPTTAGIFHAVQTLLQLVGANITTHSAPSAPATTTTAAFASHSCTMGPVRIEDFPDAAMRGVYMYGGWYDDFNRTFLTSTIDAMAKYKHNFGIFDGGGGTHFFYAMMNKTAGGGTDPNGDSLARNYTFYKEYMAQRHIDFIPNLSAGSGGVSDAWNPNIAEGVWVRDTLFDFNASHANAVHSPTVALKNGNFSRGLDGWTVLGHGPPPLHGTDSAPPGTGARAGEPLCSYNITFGPGPGLGSVGCYVTQGMPKVPHTMTIGLKSELFATEAAGLYAWSAKVYTVGASYQALATGFAMSIRQSGSDRAHPDLHGAAGTNMGFNSDGSWVTLSGTFLADDCQNGTAFALAWVDGNYTGSFWLADVKLIKLNAALVNVIRTNGTDINVTGLDGREYVRGVDFTVQDASNPNMASAVDLVRSYESGNTYRILRLDGGSIKAGQRVRVSFDMLGGYVGEVGDGE